MSVSPENANSSRVSGLMDVVTDTEGSANLEKWLADSSRSWGAASVRELDAEALATIVMADVPGELSYVIRDVPGCMLYYTCPISQALPAGIMSHASCFPSQVCLRHCVKSDDRIHSPWIEMGSIRGVGSIPQTTGCAVRTFLLVRGLRVTY